jgi:hypothetical protein
MDTHRAGFLWSGDRDANKKKNHMVAWPVVCLPKDLGGVGVLDLDIMNISLLSKWLWKLFNDKGEWQIVLTHGQKKKNCANLQIYFESHSWSSCC